MVQKNNSVDEYKVFTLAQRQKALQDRRVQTLFASLPENIAKKCERAFLANDHSGKDAQDVLKYFLQTSEITQAVVEDKGGADIFYYLYNKIANNLIDQYFLDCNAGHQIYRRLKTMENEIPDILRRLFPGDGPIIIDNIGSGQGYDMINVLADPQNADLRERVHVRNIDPNEPALKVGWERVVEHGLESNFEICVDKIGSYEGRNADFLVASGIFCPLSVPFSIRMMRNHFAGYLRDGGFVLYNATTMKMIEGDPFTDFTMRFMGWYMGFKTVNDIKSIAVRSKRFRIISVFFDTDDNGKEVGYNQMVLAQKK